MKAVETCFPQTTTLLCCRNLEKNVRQRLQDKVGVPAKVWQDTVRRVFGAERLAGGRFRTTLDPSGCFLVWPEYTDEDRAILGQCRGSQGVVYTDRSTHNNMVTWLTDVWMKA